MDGDSTTAKENPMTAAVGVVVLDADRVEFRAFCAGSGCGPAVAVSVAAVADAAGPTAAGRRSEQDPVAVLAAVRRCVDGAVAAGGWVTGAHARTMAARVLAVAVVERHRGGSVVAWDRRTGAPLCNAILWSDDGGQCRLRPRRRRRGPRAPRDRPSSVPFTVQWLLDNDAGVRAANGHGVCCFGTIGNWIVWNLTGGVNGGVFAADPSANTLFAPLTANRSPPEWDEKQLTVFGISPESLPRIQSAYSLYGFVRDGPLRETPVSCVLGNLQSSVERSTTDSATSSAASVEIEGGLSSIVPPAHFARTTTPAGLSHNEPPRWVNDGNRVVIEDDDEVLPISVSVRITVDVIETADSVLRAADHVIASEEYENAQPIDRRWPIGATMAAVVGVGALLVFAGYKMLARK